MNPRVVHRLPVGGIQGQFTLRPERLMHTSAPSRVSVQGPMCSPSNAPSARAAYTARGSGPSPDGPAPEGAAQHWPTCPLPPGSTIRNAAWSSSSLPVDGSQQFAAGGRAAAAAEVPPISTQEHHAQRLVKEQGGMGLAPATGHKPRRAAGPSGRAKAPWR